MYVFRMVKVYLRLKLGPLAVILANQEHNLCLKSLPVRLRTFSEHPNVQASFL